MSQPDKDNNNIKYLISKTDMSKFKKHFIKYIDKEYITNMEKWLSIDDNNKSLFNLIVGKKITKSLTENETNLKQFNANIIQYWKQYE